MSFVLSRIWRNDDISVVDNARVQVFLSLSIFCIISVVFDLDKGQRNPWLESLLNMLRPCMLLFDPAAMPPALRSKLTSILLTSLSVRRHSLTQSGRALAVYHVSMTYHT